MTTEEAHSEEHGRMWEAIGEIATVHRQVEVAAAVLDRVETKVDDGLIETRRVNGSVADIREDYIRIDQTVKVLWRLVVVGIPIIIGLATIGIGAAALVVR
jgi:hypothetical protein